MYKKLFFFSLLSLSFLLSYFLSRTPSKSKPKPEHSIPFIYFLTHFSHTARTEKKENAPIFFDQGEREEGIRVGKKGKNEKKEEEEATFR